MITIAFDKTQNTHILLPEPILQEIVSFLSPENIARLLTINKEWCRLLSGNELWIKLCPRISVANPKEGFYLTRYPDLMGITLGRQIRAGNLKVLKSLYSHTGSIDCLKLSGESIISGSSDTTICVRDRALCLQTKSPIVNSYDAKTECMDGHPDGVIDLDFIDDNMVILGFYDNTMLIKNRSTEQIVCRLVGHEEMVRCLKVSGERIISGSDDKTIRIWDQNGLLLRTLEGHEEAVTCLQVIGQTIISGSEDKTVRIWDLVTDLPPKILPERHTAPITCLKATHTTIVSGSDDKTICIWDRSNCTLKHSLDGHEAGITCLEIVDNILISSSQNDGTMRVWDLFTGQLLQKLELGKVEVPKCMVFIDNTLITGSSDGTIQIWGA